MEKLIEQRLVDEPELELELELELKINSTPLKYKEITKDIKNILLIDVSVAQSDILFNSTNSNTLGIWYSNYSDRDELLTLLTDNFQTIDRLGFVFNDGLINSKQFMNSELFFTREDLEDGISNFSPNVKFILEIIKKFSITNIDYLVCNGLKEQNWVKYFTLLNKETGVIVGASDNETGNIKYGGDWILESTNEDITNIYWNYNISNYTSTLVITNITSNGGTVYLKYFVDTLINYSFDNTTWIPIGSNWPVQLTNTSSTDTLIDTLTVLFTNDLIIGVGPEISDMGKYKYFIIGSNNITIDGANNNLTINSVSDYPGLVKNGTPASNGYSNIIIQNIYMDCISSSQITNGFAGWFCWEFYGSNGFNNQLINLSSNGNITARGGITGSSLAKAGEIEISNCYSTGGMFGFQSSGICGQQAGSNGGTVNITNCYSTGDMSGFQSSGICGQQAGTNGGTVNITNCDSSGLISGLRSSGICGQQAGSNGGTVNITNCYTSGNIIGDYTGGICGSSFGYNSNELNQITNCYSTGNIIGQNSGGIFGTDVGYNDNPVFTPNVLIENCYTLGNTSGGATGSICGGTSSNMYKNKNTPTVNIKNCYTLYGPIVSLTLQINPILTNTYVEFLTNTWTDSRAQLYLLGTPTYNTSGLLVNPIGTVWADIAPLNNSIPWLFSTFGYSPYTTNLTTTFTQTVIAGNKSSPSIDTTSGHIYTIISINDNIPSIYPSINIDSLTGQISIGLTTNSETYLIKILQQSNYTLTNFELIVPKSPNKDRCKEFYVKLKENEKFIINLNVVYSKYALIEKYRIIKKPKHGHLSLNQKNKLVYTPNKNYTGKDEFILGCINLIPELSIEITFKIKIKE